ncbi:substrate-binding domain-containing protein [Novosphingobium gossypii]|uniref:substrate-binding domain-containing protein n=1 Tax=Novosphingobium gossypii TaxID=1604774 RepID=UPI003D24F601
MNAPAPLGDTSRADRRSLTAIERAGYLPEPSPRDEVMLPLPDPVARPGPTPIVALLHDGRNRDVLAAIETGLGAVFHGTDRLIVLHGLPPEEEAGSLAYFLDRHRPSGVVMVPSLAERDDLAALCARAGVECLRIGGHDLPGCNERRAAGKAVDRLVELGHTRIGLVAGPEGSASARRRELGYLDAMAEHGLDRGPALIVGGDDTFASGIEAGHLLLEISPRPTAILACNDEMAAGVLHAASQVGVAVPEALSVIGFDDTPLAARTLPPLASMRLPWSRAGHDAARWLSGAAPAPAPPPEPDLIARASLGRPAQI